MMQSPFTSMLLAKLSQILWLAAILSSVIHLANSLSCVQCMSLDTPRCKKGDVPATLCKGQDARAKYCFKSRATHINGHDEVISRGCTDNLQSNCSDNVKNGEIFKTCHYSCTEDGCNGTALLTHVLGTALRALVSSVTAVYIFMA